MTYYKYRWPCSILLFMFIMAGGLIFVLQPEQTALQHARKMESQLQQAILQARLVKSNQLPNVPVYRYHYVDALSMLFFVAQQTPVVIQYVRMQASLPAQDSVQIAAEGSFKQLGNFMLALQRQPILMVVTDFSYRLLGTSQLQLVMNVQLIKWGKARQSAENKPFLHEQSAFCTQDEAMLNARADLTAIQMVPVAGLKMVGYLQQRDRVEAWLRLPNAGLVSVTKADRIGKERGMITQITPEQVVIATMQGTQIIRNEAVE